MKSLDHKHLAQLDHNHVWHPFTPQSRWTSQDPLIVDHAEGCWLVDTNGNRYLDAVSSLWVNVHGHRQPDIDQAIRDQLEKVAHSTMLGLSNVPATLLAAKLVEIAPAGLTRVFYSDNGSTAVEIALKMAFQYWQLTGHPNKTEFIALKDAYHGDTIGSVSLGGISLFHRIFHPLLFDVHRIANPYWYRCAQAPQPDACRDQCLGQLSELLDRRASHIAALVIEPLVQGAAGMIVQPEGFLHGVEHLCRKHDVLLICDEVATGFGRTGTLFASEQEHVHPDLMALAKGITGGYLPVAATLTSEAIYQAFAGTDPSKHTFFHGHTYTGNPLGCAAAIANIDVFQRDRVIDAVVDKAAHLASLLDQRIAPLAHCGQIRQKGLMVGIELVADTKTKQPFAPSQYTGYRVCQAARKHHVILRPLGDVIVLMPPLGIRTDELDHLVHTTEASIKEITQ